MKDSMTQIPQKNLVLGDVVRLGDFPFADGIVQRVEEHVVTIFRPYAMCENFSCTSGVICYTGIEQVPLSRSEALITLLRKNPVS